MIHRGILIEIDFQIVYHISNKIVTVRTKGCRDSKKEINKSRFRGFPNY